MADHDNDAISLLTLCWSQAKAHMPTEIIGSIENSLEESKLPRIATRNVPEGVFLLFYYYFILFLNLGILGLGYQLEIAGKTYTFPFFERAPPEGYLSQDYVAYVFYYKKSSLELLISCAISRPVHIDKCYAQYGLGWCIGREVDDGTQSPGGNFIDVSLRVAIKQDTGTLMAFQPQYPHGTTQLAGAHNRTCAITFSEHIFKAYEKARVAEGLTTIESGSGL